MSYQQFRKVISLPPDPPRINNINYICIKYCPKALDHLNTDFEEAHNAASDVAATAKCFWELRRLGLI